MHSLKNFAFRSLFFKFVCVLIFAAQVGVSRANFNLITPISNVVAYNMRFTTPWLFTGISLDDIRLNTFYQNKMEVYDSLHLDLAGLSREAFELALHGMEKLILSGYPMKDNILSIADFSQPSTQKRLYIVDLNNFELLFNTYVAHGRNTGKTEAEEFSNNISSNKSSLGFYLTGNTYRGKHGYSLKLEGLEKGINDNAEIRAIVMHAANYVDPNTIQQLGYLGRSQGCPAIPAAMTRPIIDEIKDGSCLFIYHHTSWYLQQSRLLN